MYNNSLSKSESLLAKGIVLIFSANVINAFFNAVTNFLLPKYLSIDAYSQVKSYYLYLSYVGILHLGYSDGVYLRYGGKKVGDISTSEIKKDISTMRIFQTAVSLMAIVISCFLHDVPLLMCSLTILPYNMAYFYRYLYQAVGEFKEYSKIMNYTAIGTFAANSILLLLQINDIFLPYLCAYVIVNVLIWLILELSIYHKLDDSISSSKYFDFAVLVKNVKSGFLLMLGTFSSIVLTGMDRWFIKALMDNSAFAFYSFAVSIEGLLNIAVTPVTTTLYNYFCNHRNEEDKRYIKSYIIILISIIIASCFLVKIVIDSFIPKYRNSITVLCILFAAQIFFIYLKSIYVNLYKAEKRQNIYFKNLVIVIAAGALLNYAMYSINPVKEAFAIGTLLSAMLWYIISMFDLRDKQTDVKNSISLLLLTAVFLFCGIKMSAVYGIVIYVFTACLIICSFHRNAAIKLYYLAKSMIKHN